MLSEEAGRTFRFQEQEQLHEEIIDSGIAKIYQSHLEMARSVAEAEGMEIVCELLDGKPYQAVARYLDKVGASLLLVGKTGIHADAELDIGGNAENLLRMAPSHVWFGQASYTPPLETVARETITWTEEAEAKMGRVPEAARKMVRMAILRFAQESGHTAVTSALIEEATARFCPERGGVMDAGAALAWSGEAARLLETVGDPSVNTSIRLRAVKRARRAKSKEVMGEHVRPFLEDEATPAPVWSAAALARLARVPDMVASAGSLREADFAMLWRNAPLFAELRAPRLEGRCGACEDAKLCGCCRARPLAPGGNLMGEDFLCGYQPGGGATIEPLLAATSGSFPWTPEAEARLERVPSFVRRFVRRRAKDHAREIGAPAVTAQHLHALTRRQQRELRAHQRLLDGARAELGPGVRNRYLVRDAQTYRIPAHAFEFLVSGYLITARATGS